MSDSYMDKSNASGLTPQQKQKLIIALLLGGGSLLGLIYWLGKEKKPKSRRESKRKTLNKAEAASTSAATTESKAVSEQAEPAAREKSLGLRVSDFESKSDAGELRAERSRALQTPKSLWGEQSHGGDASHEDGDEDEPEMSPEEWEKHLAKHFADGASSSVNMKISPAPKMLHTAPEEHTQAQQQQQQQTPGSRSSVSSTLRARLNDRASGVIMGTAVGDAKGIPYEMMTKAEIQKLREQRGEIDKDGRPTSKPVPLYAKVSGTNPYILKDWKPGRWTDDTQLTAAVMRALLLHYGKDGTANLDKVIPLGEVGMKIMVDEHVKEFTESVYGWGGTRNAIARLKDGSKTWTNSGNIATGNGVLMKLAPLGLFYATVLPPLDPENDADWRFSEIEQLTRMTHNTAVAVVTALVFMAVCDRVFRLPPNALDEPAARKELLQYAKYWAHIFEIRNGMHGRSPPGSPSSKARGAEPDAEETVQPESSPASASTATDSKDQKNDSLQQEHKKAPKPQRSEAELLVSLRIETMLAQFKSDKTPNITDEALLHVAGGGDHFCVNSLTMVLGILASQKPTMDSIIRATLIGGDTDSNAAMVGALIGGLKGESAIDLAHVRGLYKLEQLAELGLDFGSLLCSRYRDPSTPMSPGSA